MLFLSLFAVDIFKYFYEEPAPLEMLSPDLDANARPRAAALKAEASPAALEAFLRTPTYYRGYLAGTNLATEHVGFTALDQAATLADLVLAWIGPGAWTVGTPPDAIASASAEEVRALIQDPGGTAVLAWQPSPAPSLALAPLLHQERRPSLPALRAALDAGAVLLFPEPAHHGHDWSVFAAHPLRDALRRTLQAQPLPEGRCFLVPFRKARSESKFYFESWQLDALPPHIEEVC